jgi:hypothetical protein
MKITATLLQCAAVCAAMIAMPRAADAQFQRIVLLEEYTSVTCVPCATAGRNVNAVLQNNPSRIVSVRYHTNFIPTPKDRFYEANRAENETRRDFYGWAAMPKLRVDGELEPSATDMNEVQARVDDELARESPLQIAVTQEPFEANWRRVVVTVTAGPDGLASGYHLRTVAVEALVHDPLFGNSPYNGEVDVRDIMRRFLPNTDGEAIELGPNETKTFTYTYTVDDTWQPDQMYAVAFVQDDFDKSVEQAGFSPKPVAGIEDAALAGYSLASLAPNPSSGALRLDVTLGRPGRLAVSVYDAAGRLVRTLDGGPRSAGSSSLALDLGGLGAGAYTCVVSAGAWRQAAPVIVR